MSEFPFFKKEGCRVAEGWAVAKTGSHCISILLFFLLEGKNLHFLALLQMR